jgi:hypothetical protein
MRAPVAVAVAVRKNRSVSYYIQISIDTSSTSRLNATDRGGQLLLGHDSVVVPDLSLTPDRGRTQRSVIMLLDMP